jgi:hypothetical protein
MATTLPSRRHYSASAAAAGRSAADHGPALYLDDLKMPGASRDRGAPGPRRGQHQRHRHQSGAGRGRAWRRCSGAGEIWGAAVRRVAAGCACRITIAGAGPGSREPSGGRDGGHRPLHRTRRGGPGGSEYENWGGDRPREGDRRGRAGSAPKWPDNVAFTFHQEGGDTDQAFRDAG